MKYFLIKSKIIKNIIIKLFQKMGPKNSKTHIKDIIGEKYICPTCNETFQENTPVKKVKIIYKNNNNYR